MDSPKSPNQGARVLLMVASFVVIVAGLKAAAKLLVPFLSAFFLAMISLPLLNWLRSKKIPTGLAVFVTLIAALSILAVITVLVGGSVKSFTEEVPKYKARLNMMWVDTIHRLQTLGIDISEKKARNLIEPASAFDAASSALKGLATIMSNLFLVLLTIVFILFEAAGFPNKLQEAFGDRESSDRYEVIKSEIQKYLGTKTVVSLATGALIAIALTVIGVDFPLLWGLLAFLLNYIPSLGSIIAAVPPVLLAMVQLGPRHAIAVAVTFAVVNIALGYFIEPYFMGRRMGLSTLVVFLSLVFWGWVWGPMGMLLSVPMTMILKILLENLPDLRWISVLLGPSPRARGDRDPS